MAAAWMTRVVLQRTGLVLDSTRRGVAEARASLPAASRADASDPAISTGRGFTATTGRALVRWAIDRTEIKGPINLTAPSPVTNREFSSARVAHALASAGARAGTRVRDANRCSARWPTR